MDKFGKYPRNWIKELREKRGWTLRELADKTGWHHQTLSNLELSKAELTHSKIKVLAGIFEIHPSEVTEGPGSVAIAHNETQSEALKIMQSMSDREQELYLSGLKAFAAAKENPADHSQKAAKESKK